MKPEEARAKLLKIFDESAEARRQHSVLYFTETGIWQSGRGTKRFYRFFIVNANMEIECLDFLLRKAVDIDFVQPGYPMLDQTYGPALGFRFKTDGFPTVRARLQKFLEFCLTGSGFQIDNVEFKEL